jgi:hypothetical protein
VPLHTGALHELPARWACSALDVLAAILNSPFVLSLLGAAAGAGVGAIVATRLVAKRQRREELTAEIRSTNVATMVALAICHKVLSLKRAHVLPLATKFAADMAAWNEFMRQRRTGERQGNTPPPISIDLRVVPSMTFPVVTLQRLLSTSAPRWPTTSRRTRSGCARAGSRNSARSTCPRPPRSTSPPRARTG